MNRVVLFVGLLGLLGLAPSLASADGMRMRAEAGKHVQNRPEPQRFVMQKRRVADWKRGLQPVNAVPELDPGAAPIALALLAGGAALMAEGRRRKAAVR